MKLKSNCIFDLLLQNFIYFTAFQSAVGLLLKCFSFFLSLPQQKFETATPPSKQPQTHALLARTLTLAISFATTKKQTSVS